MGAGFARCACARGTVGGPAHGRLSRGDVVPRDPYTPMVCDNNENIVGMVTSNVDDLLFGVTGPAEEAMRRVLEGFNVREVQEKSFRFCGKRGS